VGRRPGMSNSASWVEVIIWPLGFRIWIGFLVGRLLRTLHLKLQ
jgi:hypothetical protein